MPRSKGVPPKIGEVPDGPLVWPSHALLRGQVWRAEPRLGHRRHRSADAGTRGAHLVRPDMDEIVNETLKTLLGNVPA
ncbi:hypothetical protein GCM10027026_11800 [Myroides odoratimimus subsp. xuanwuensis]